MHSIKVSKQILKNNQHVINGLPKQRINIQERLIKLKCNCIKRIYVRNFITLTKKRADFTSIM